MYPVKIFDGEGNLLRVVQPVFDPDPKTNRKFRAHPCPRCGDNTTKKKYCNMCILEREKKTRPDEKGS